MKLIELIMAIIFGLGALFGVGAMISHRVNKNFDLRYEQDKAERDAAKKEADEREQARIERQVLLEEQLVAVGYVAKETAEDHLDKHGPNKKIATALETYADCRRRSENQLRKSASKYEQRIERVAQ